MNTTSSGAVGFAPVGTFVKDLAQELGKSASTVAAYIKKHLPSALVKRKNANNRQANFALEQAVEAVRSHYSPSADNSLLQELERLRDENKRLRALLVDETDDANITVDEIERKFSEIDSLAEKALEAASANKLEYDEANTNRILAEAASQMRDAQEFIDKYKPIAQKLWRKENEQQPKKRKLGALLDDLHSQQQQSSFLVDRQGHRLNNLRLKEQGLRQLTFEEYRSQSNESVQKNQATATRDREFTEGKPKVIDIFRRIKGSD